MCCFLSCSIGPHLFIYVLVPHCVNFSPLFFFFKITLPILGPEVFYAHFKINWSNSTKHPVGILTVNLTKFIH